VVRGKPVPSEPLGILLLSGTHERAHYAFVLATGAAALGRRVVLFATNAGCRALLADWSAFQDAERDAVIRARGVAGLDELRDAARELGVRLIACEAGLRAEALYDAPRISGVETAGVATFLEAVGSGQMLAL
jgi:peroxiredoxin family protein